MQILGFLNKLKPAYGQSEQEPKSQNLMIIITQSKINSKTHSNPIFKKARVDEKRKQNSNSNLNEMTGFKFINKATIQNQFSFQNLQLSFSINLRTFSLMKSHTIISTYSEFDLIDSFAQKNLFKGFKSTQQQSGRNPEASHIQSKLMNFKDQPQITISKEKCVKSESTINYQPMSPYCFSMKSKKSSFLDDDTETQASDRFIPSRKFIHRQTNLIEENEEVANENYVPPAVDPHHFTASEIYKRFIMADNKTENGNLISKFESNNFFKYNENKRNSILAENTTFGSKKTEFDFTQKLLESTSAKRKISKLPYKVLDAPALQDDFYLNLIDWGNQNFLAVGLSSNVYLWNGNNSKVTKLCDLGLSDTVTSVGWSVKGPMFSLGTNNGELHLWDLNKMKRVRTMGGHSDRIASIAWNNEVVCTGSRDKTILQRDPRCKGPFFSKLTNHKQEVCGLKWSPDGQQLCSGGNDNKLYIWNLKSNEPVVRYSDHVAAVKAVTWSPHQHGLLLSGGGTADKTIKFRNTLEGTTIKSIDTGSQVCNLIFSKTLNEFVSTHGFSLNEINVWKYPKMEKISTLTGHTFRVLYLAMSPDGSTVVTGAGDETLRFWKVFPGRNQINKPLKSFLNVDNINIR